MIEGIGPEEIRQGAGAIKAALDAFKAAVGLVREAKDTLPSSDRKDAVSKALDEAEKAAKIAEAQLAKALGYEICRAHFPPVVMLEVGFMRDGKRAFECPVCGNDSAKPYSFTRTAPPRIKGEP